MKIAGAPISWGVSEVPGWGHQLDVARVLEEMRAVGLTATELGPDGFVSSADLLAAQGLQPVGGFVPVILHKDDHAPVREVTPVLDAFATMHADVVVLSADTGATNYDDRIELEDAQWKLLLTHLDAVADAAAKRGLLATLHPHVGTLIERPNDVQKVLQGSNISLCLDTGHYLIGGGDPVGFASEHADRIAHVHLKDVDESLAARVRDGSASYTEMVGAGMYRPLGTGDIDIAAIVASLGSYDGWYVLEQDTVLAGEPPPDTGPIDDMRASLDYLRSLA